MKKKKKQKPVTSLTPPVEMIKVIVEVKWEEKNNKGGLILQGVGTGTGCKYHIKLAKGGRTFRAIRRENGDFPEKIASCFTLQEAQDKCGSWERKYAPTLYIEVPKPPDPEEIKKEPEKPTPSPELPKLRDRVAAGKHALFNMGTVTHGDGYIRLKYVGEIKWPPPRTTDANNYQKLLEWWEYVLDEYEARNIWLTKSAVKSFLVNFRSRSYFTDVFPNQGQIDRFVKITSILFAYRAEPEELSDNYRVRLLYNQWMESERNKVMSKKSEKTAERTTHTPVNVERTEKVSVDITGKSKTKKTLDIQAEVGRGKTGGKRFTILGLPMAAVLRWMGSQGWKRADARKVMDALGLTEVKDSTISVKLYNGQGKGTGGEIPELTKEQIRALTTLRDSDAPPKKKPVKKPEKTPEKPIKPGKKPKTPEPAKTPKKVPAGKAGKKPTSKPLGKRTPEKSKTPGKKK